MVKRIDLSKASPPTDLAESSPAKVSQTPSPKVSLRMGGEKSRLSPDPVGRVRPYLTPATRNPSASRIARILPG